MEASLIKSLEKFVNNRLPEIERKRVILVVKGKPLNWLQIIEELKKDDESSKEVEKEFMELIK